MKDRGSIVSAIFCGKEGEEAVNECTTPLGNGCMDQLGPHKWHRSNYLIIQLIITLSLISKGSI